MFATLMVPFAEQVGTVSPYPRCIMASPILAALLRASTWLLPSMYCLPFLVTREPSVPVQQNCELISFTLLPLVPNLIGGVCCAVFPPKAKPAARNTMRADRFIREGGKTAFFINISSGGNQVQVPKILPCSVFRC